jgi:hypothetical protein
MKKKIAITWVLVIAFAICTVPAFAQQKLVALTAKTLERETLSVLQCIGSVKVYLANGKEPEDKVNPIKKQNQWGSFFLGEGWSLETGKDGYAYIFGQNNNASIFQALKKQIWIQVGPNSRIVRSTSKDKNHIFTLTKGTWQEDKGAKELAKFDEFMEFLSCAESQKIANQVAKWKKDNKFASNDALADYVIAQKSTKNGFLGGIAGIGGALSGPNQFLGVIADWCVQAEMAYAVACVYREKPPSQAEFKRDLYFLLCDEGIIDSSIKDEAIKFVHNKAKDIVKDEVLKLADKEWKKLMENIAKRQTNKMAQEVANAAGTKAIPVLSAFISGGANFAATKSFGNKAKSYYKK